MKVLVCGGSGFIGSALSQGLRAAGHEVIRGVRRPETSSDISIDYGRDVTPAAWVDRLRGFDAVVNAVGIIVEQRTARFVDLHQRAPIALFNAAAQVGVRRIIQISALGANRGTTPYFITKFAADTALRALAIEWQILRPSLVYGDNGASAMMFRTVATLPILVVPALGEAAFQPVHIDDVVAAVVRAVAPESPARQEVDVVGATRVTYRAMLESYRRALGLRPTLCLTIPAPMMALAARCAALVPGAPLTPDTWSMLRAGSAGDDTALTHLLGRPPRGIEEFIPADAVPTLRAQALAGWCRPFLAAVLALTLLVLTIGFVVVR
ncbi:MAG: NAD(P)H-binding protein [Gammaproteobacteria bacterium]|nr:NAD(P)H-binding protein [Gammaproteobacteria bacterium]